MEATVGDPSSMASRNPELTTRASFQSQGSSGDSFTDKVGRELDVIVGGTASGIARAAVDAIENPLPTIAKIGGSALVGAGLTAMEIACPELRPVGMNIGGALGVS